MNNSRILGVIVVLQGLMLMTLWLGGPALPQAQAQVPDAGGQRLQMIDQLKQLNDKMDRLIGILNSGNLQVKVAKDDEQKDAANRRAVR